MGSVWAKLGRSKLVLAICPTSKDGDPRLARERDPGAILYEFYLKKVKKCGRIREIIKRKGDT